MHKNINIMNIMKKALFTLLCVLGLTGCAQAQKQKENKKMKTLVTYFSATGTTKAVAEKMAKAGGDITGAEKNFRAAYPELNWQKGRLLNSPSDKEIKEFMK